MDKRSVRMLVSYGAYGAVLTLLGLLSTGMGEGSSAIFAAFGSPFSLVGPLFVLSPFITWFVIGGWVATNKRLVGATLLVMHYLLIVPAVRANLREPGNWANDTRLLRLACGQDKCLLLMTPYIVGQLITWVLLVRGLRANRFETTV